MEHKEYVETGADDEKLISRSTILRVVLEIQKHFLEGKSKERKSIFDAGFKYSLQIVLLKIPQGSGSLKKMFLPHSLIDETDEVCLVVKDLERGAKKDFSLTKDHFEEILKFSGVTRINRVIPLNDLRINYGSFEAKLKLCQSFDVFLVDSRIYNHTIKLFGKHFLKRKRLPLPVEMDCGDINQAIIKALRYTIYRQNNTGNVIAIDVGNHWMSAENITENISNVISQLKGDGLNGWQNIRSIYVKTTQDYPLSIPIYLSDATGEDICVPEAINQKDLVLSKKRKQVNSVLENEGFTKKGFFTSKINC
ncbi:ribosomal L1 domain-containing protein CG13096-like [Lutzomyia longipalpis]|nr:ribosomal L1 domain-containing protein CG13096-like [Lutzomyia longipalpis]